MPSKRRGQALLLAVLLMVFAALLGSTFITVVALNLNQTARQEDQSSARQAATAGLQLINQNLTNSPQGEKWRPEMLTPPPAPTDPDYNFYYTAIDRAQGWARNIAHPPDTNDLDNDGQAYKVGAVINDLDEEWLYIEQQRNLNPSLVAYVKFPDPRTATLTATTPTFLAEVRRVSAINSSDPSKYGMLEVSVIGLSENNEAVVERRVAYKGGYAQNPLTAAARSVTNWDFVNNVVPEAKVQNYTPPILPSDPITLTITNLKGILPAAPFYITIGDPNTNVGFRAVAVESVTGSTLNLATQPSPAPIENERVEIAAGLGTPRGVDYDNSGGDPTTTEYVNFEVSDDAGGNVSPGATIVNGGVAWFGDIFTRNLRSSELGATATSATGAVRSSGGMVRFPDGYGAGTAAVRVNGNYRPNGSSGTLPQSNLVNSSAVANFPGDWRDTAGQTLKPEEKNQIWSDGWYRLAGRTDSVRQNRPFVPPSIDLNKTSVNRYRELTKFSAPYDDNDAITPALPSNAGLYGFGEGIYINNPEDKERIGVSNVPGPYRYREMTQEELRNLWFSSAQAQPYYRLGTPSQSTLPATGQRATSLEEQHFRGWVSPDEFRGRGPLIEINANNTITITLESRTDGNATNDLGPNLGPVGSKGWRLPTGAAQEGDATLGGVFRRPFAWPTNGTIFLEGNARVRGVATNPPRSLTIVSMGNIYVEDSVGAGATRKVLLLAKKNVVMNPTRVLGHPDGQTLLSAQATSSNTIQVYDSEIFNVGDYIKIETGSPNDEVFGITAIAPTTKTLTLDANTATQSQNSVVRIASDPLNTTALPFNQHATRLSQFSHVLQRRFIPPAGTTNIRLAIRHNAERKPGFTVGTENAALPPNPTSVLYAHKPATSAQTTIIEPATKYIEFDFSPDSSGSNPSGFDQFPNPIAVNTEANARLFDVGDLATAIQPGSNNWQYTATVDNNFAARNAPFYFLASVGNRPDITPLTAPSASPPTLPNFPFPNFRKDIWKLKIPPPTIAERQIPMATSVVLTVNGIVPAALRSDQRATTTTTASGFEEVRQFGFSMRHGMVATAAELPEAWEDVLTVDQGFYHNGNDIPPINTIPADNGYYTRDSRTIGGITPNVLTTLAFRLNPQAQNYFDDGNPNQVPYYRMSRVKLENSDQLNTAAPYEFNNLQPAHTFNVQAYVYAQEGSWLVIPGDFFDENAKPDRIELTGNSIKELGENLDLNRDGTESRAEKAAAYRLTRYNYQINFTGTIMEKQTATIRNTGNIVGEVENWMSKWSTVTMDATNFDATGAPTGMNYGEELHSISYKFDDAASRGLLEDDPGFHPPVMPGYEYSG